MKVDWASKHWIPADLAPAADRAQAESEDQARAAKDKARAAAEHARHRHCAELAVCIYGADVEDWKQPKSAQGQFVDAGRNLRAAAEIVYGHAFIVFRGTVGPPLLSRNWRKVNLRAGYTQDQPPRHVGFWSAWLVLRPQVQQWLTIHRPESLTITGHSMGAALAQLAAFDLSEHWPVSRVVLFATPMIGAAAFNDAYATTPKGDAPLKLQQCTTRYLLLTDAISLPLPRLLGYLPGQPIRPIDLLGVNADRVPGFWDQTCENITGSQAQPVATPVIGGVHRGTAPDFGEPSFLDDCMGTARLLGMAYGSWSGWLGFAAFAFLSVMERAVGLHSMKRYAIALRAFPKVVNQSKRTWAGRRPFEPPP